MRPAEERVMVSRSVRTAGRHNAYVDSVTLLQVSAEVSGVPGVEDAALVMGTDLNRDVLRDSGLLIGDAVTAGPNDLVIAVRAVDELTIERALNEADLVLAGRRSRVQAAARTLPRSLRSAH